MERILTENERLRRAEEICHRRKYPGEKRYYTEKNPKNYLGSKILLELLILVNITVIVFCVQNYNEIFSEKFLNKINSYGINLKTSVIEFFEAIKSLPSDASVFQNNEENKVEENNEQVVPEENQTGGLMQENLEVENTNTELLLSGEEKDSEKLKKNYTFVKPVEGTVTSIFGSRESKNQKINGYHTGIDIGANNETMIVAATEGKVTLVSSQGDYGKHIKIENGELLTLYAHCLEILVKEGEEVSLGQNIAKVGSTGNSTGPHLHFEVRYQNRYVNPSEIIEF